MNIETYLNYYIFKNNFNRCYPKKKSLLLFMYLNIYFQLKKLFTYQNQFSPFSIKSNKREINLREKRDGGEGTI